MLLLLEVSNLHTDWLELPTRQPLHPLICRTQNPLPVAVGFAYMDVLCKQNHTIGVWFLTPSTMFLL